MKQAIIILAHNDIGLLIHLVEYFRHDCDVFIHIDKRRQVASKDMERLQSLSQVSGVYQRYAVHWGGFSILKTQMFMLREAYRLSDAQTFHVISGHDYPIKPLSRFLDFFDKNKDYNYVAYGRVRSVGTDADSYYRYQYFFPYDYAGDRPQLAVKTSRWVKLQRKLHINRGLPTQFDRLYCGSQWFSVSRLAVNKLIDYTRRHPSFYRRLKFTFAPEETYFLTVMLNLCDPKSIIRKNLRFIRWRKENGNSPANLSVEHFHLLAESDDFFARKIVEPYCDELVSRIDKYLLADQEPEATVGGISNKTSLVGIDYDPGLTEAVFNYCDMMPCYEVLDVACGAGAYVAALRRLGIFATGIDSNPHTEELSSLLLPKNDQPCQCGNIAGDMEADGTFGLVMCIDVLQNITDTASYQMAVDNIVQLAGQTIVLGSRSQCGDTGRESYLSDRLRANGFAINRFASTYFKRHAKRHGDITVYERKG